MKKFAPYFYIFLICISFIFSMNSCKKENQNNCNNPELSVIESQKILKLVNDFLVKKSSNLKIDESLSVDSTIWYLETSINATYARMDSIKKVLLLDSAFIDIPVNNEGSIDLRNIYIAFDQLVDSLASFYYSINGDKTVIVNDIFLVGVENNQIQVGITMILAQIPVPPQPINVWFDASDNWFWGLNAGKCNSTYLGRDASTELTTHANFTIPIAPPGQSYIWINIEQTPELFPTDVPLPYGQTNPYGYDAYYLFSNGSSILPEYDDCLTYDQMNYYLQNLFTISSIFQPQNKEAIHYYCSFDLTVGIGYWLHIHKLQITYGTRITIVYPPQEPPLEE